MNWTPEPWTVIHLDDEMAEIYAPNYKACDGKSIPIADAERIAACVNACRGIPTEFLNSVMQRMAVQFMRDRGYRVELPG